MTSQQEAEMMLAEYREARRIPSRDAPAHRRCHAPGCEQKLLPGETGICGNCALRGPEPQPSARDWARLGFETVVLAGGMVGTVLAIGHALALAFGWR